MSGASFAITLDELEIIIANDRGYSLDRKKWNEKQKYAINDIVVSGVANVYFPPAVGEDKVAPDWTWLKPISEIALRTGERTVNLPDDFGNFNGGVAIKTDSTTTAPWWLKWSTDIKILEWYSTTPLSSGPPMYIADTASRIVQAPTGQLRQLMVFPLPDQDYILRVSYSINPDKLSGARPYAYGGAQYRELYISSCRAVAEERYDLIDEGPAMKQFRRMLIMAVSQDNKNRPQALGYNGNNEPVSWRGQGRHNQGLNLFYNDELIT